MDAPRLIINLPQLSSTAGKSALVKAPSPLHQGLCPGSGLEMCWLQLGSPGCPQCRAQHCRAGSSTGISAPLLLPGAHQFASHRRKWESHKSILSVSLLFRGKIITPNKNKLAVGRKEFLMTNLLQLGHQGLQLYEIKPAVLRLYYSIYYCVLLD